MTKETKLKDLIMMSKSGPLIKLDNAIFQNYINSSDKLYSFVVLFTTLSDNIECFHCSEAFKSLSLISEAWNKNSENTKDLFFGYLDYQSRGLAVFKMYDLKHIPHIYYFGKKTSKPEVMKAYLGYHVKYISRFIQSTYGVKITPVIKDYFSVLLVVGYFSLLISTCYYLHNFNPQAFSKISMSVICSLTVLMISGHMQSFSQGKTSRESWFFAGKRFQNVLECPVIFVLLCGTTSGFLVMDKAIVMKGKISKVICLLGLVIFIVCFKVYSLSGKEKLGIHINSYIFDF